MGFLESLVDQSSITRRQLESLTSYMRVSTGEFKLKDAALLASHGRTRGRREAPLTVGSYYRTVHQARRNVRKSLVTIVIALWMGVIRAEDVHRLFDLVGGGTRELSDEDAEQFTRLLDALLRRIMV